MGKTNRFKVLGLLSLPLLGLAIAVMVLSFGHSASTQTEAVNTGSKTEMDVVIAGTLGVGNAVNCDSSAQTKCSLGTGSTFTVDIVPSTIPAGGYAGWQTLLNYGSLIYKAAVGEDNFSAGILPVRSPGAPTGKEGFVGHGNVTAFFPDPVSGLFPVSNQKTSLVTLTINCTQNAGGNFSETIFLTDFNQSPSGATFVLDDGTTTNVPNVGSIDINCQTPPTPVPPTDTPTPTNTPLPTDTPSSPSVLKGPALSNLWLTAQGTKIPPVTCLTGTDGNVLSVDLSTKVTGTDKAGDSRAIGGFSFKVNYDETKVCVSIFPGSIPTAGGWDCIIYDSVTKPTLQGSATIACNQLGKAPISPAPADNLNLANILVQPMPDEYSVMRPNNGNGNVVQIINKACKVTDSQGDPVASPAGAATCTDADLTIRYLEGDVVPDCIVDTLDTQASAFRWGSQKGTLLFNEFFNLEPSKPQKDDDIDVNDLQFVYGRFGSTCANPHPKQNPVNPKAA